MPTNTRQLASSWPGASTAVSPPDADEASLYANTSLRNWFCASDGFIDGEWHCRKTGVALIPAAQGFPTRANAAAYNNDKAAVFGSVFSSVFYGGANILPVAADFSIVLVGRHGPADNAFLCGSGEGNSRDLTQLERSFRWSRLAHSTAKLVASRRAYRRLTPSLTHQVPVLSFFRGALSP